MSKTRWLIKIGHPPVTTNLFANTANGLRIPLSGCTFSPRVSFYYYYYSHARRLFAFCKAALPREHVVSINNRDHCNN
jgi:hypothetical protein